MEDIQNRLDKFLIGEDTIKEYDEFTDYENEAKETLKELAKEFGSFNGDGAAALYPYKKTDSWEVYVSVDDYDPLTYEVNVSFYDRGTAGIGGSFEFKTDEIDAKTIKEIGKLQKEYADMVINLFNKFKKFGKAPGGIMNIDIIVEKYLGEEEKSWKKPSSSEYKGGEKRLEQLMDMISRARHHDPVDNEKIKEWKKEYDAIHKKIYHTEPAKRNKK